jgi:hypothetical protein
VNYGQMPRAAHWVGELTVDPRVEHPRLTVPAADVQRREEMKCCHLGAISGFAQDALAGTLPGFGPRMSPFGAIRTMDSFRCIHASRLLLDHQLHGTRLSATEGVASAARKFVEDATLIAFERIIDACLVHDVNCLLISGDCFDPEDRSLRGPAALINGLQRLAERDIPAILQASRPDLWSSWPAGLRFPPNAHRLGEGFENAVPISRHGKLLAAVSANEVSPTGVNADAGWQILFPETSEESRTVQLHADYGPVQGIRCHETGPHGCLLIVVDADGEPRETLIPAAPVRWEQFGVSVSATMTRDDLLQDMATLLEQTPRKPCERVWLVGWEFSGEGPLLESLTERSFRDELSGELTGLDPVPNVHVHTYALRVRQPALAVPRMADHDGLATEYVSRLEKRFARPESALDETLSGSALRAGPWQAKLESLVAELDAGEVGRDAQTRALEWFASLEESTS